MNRDVFIVSSMLDNAQKQFDRINTAPPLFATFHINQSDPDKVAANDDLNRFLVQKFA